MMICHSDAEGFYVPVRFDEVIFDADDRGLAGEHGHARRGVARAS